MLAIIEERIKELETMIATAASNHNIATIVLTELKNLFPKLQAASAEAKPIIDAIGAVVPAVEPIAAVVDEVSSV